MNIREITPANSPSLKHGELCVGVEIELEGCSPAQQWNMTRGLNWTVVDDGSLRGDGTELISPPCPVSLMVEQHLPIVYGDIVKHGGVGTIRTGTHVHVDMLDKTVAQVGAICTLYALIEPQLYSMLPVDRETGIYCVPWYRAPNEAETLRNVLDSTSSNAARMWFGEGCKYTGLNIASIPHHGTLEFRMAPTFPNAEDMSNWLKLVVALVDTALHFDDGAAVLRAVAADGLDHLWPEASGLAEKYDSYYVAEVIAGSSEVTWDVPCLDFDTPDPDVTQVTELDFDIPEPDVTQVTEDEQIEQRMRTIHELLDHSIDRDDVRTLYNAPSRRGLEECVE